MLRSSGCAGLCSGEECTGCTLGSEKCGAVLSASLCAGGHLLWACSYLTMSQLLHSAWIALTWQA